MDRKIELNFFVTVFLIAVIVIESVFFIMQYKHFRQMRNSLAVSEEERIQLRTQLEEVKTKLSRQEELYRQIIKEKEALASEVNGLRMELNQNQELLRSSGLKMQTLSDNDRRSREYLESVLKRMRLLEGKINSLDEVRDSLDARLQSIRELRLRIRELKREAFLKKTEAQKELDRIKLENGNRGLVIKNGKSTLTGEREVALEKIIIKMSPQ